MFQKSKLTIHEVFQHFEFSDTKWAFGTVCYTVVIVMEYKTWRFVEEQLHSFFSPPVKLVIADGSLAQKRGKKCNNPIVCKSVEKFSDQVWEEMMHSIISSPRTLKNCENFWWPSNQSYENHIDSVLEKDVKNAHYYKKYKFSNKFSATEFLKNIFLSQNSCKNVHSLLENHKFSDVEYWKITF